MRRVVAIGALILCGLAAATQAAQVDVWFHEATPGEWQAYMQVTGSDTAGLAGYDLSVYGVDPYTVSYSQSTLGTFTFDFQVIGFSHTPAAGPAGPGYNASNSQPVDSAIVGIGKSPVYNMGGFPPVSPTVDLGVPALLGTFYTGTGLSIANFRAGDTSLLNANADGLLPTIDGLQIIVHSVYPEPASISLLAIGGLAMLRRRRQGCSVASRSSSATADGCASIR